MELPIWLEYLLIGLQIGAAVFFVWLVWPLIKGEQWRKKFIENKQAFSILIVFILIFIFVYGLGFVFDALFPVEILR
ncbi:hypothetical protein [Thiomicrospira pelophila]|uniref:hypothetical protein n=1 Tax=Thiomicrospira pelophila TaxID=934 RepID=UPI0004A6C7B8|nr:hypothetical protein [Thiomicrospira pelophila]